MSACPAQYEPVSYGRRSETHTCCRVEGHEPPHACPDCHGLWIEAADGNRVVKVGPPPKARVRAVAYRTEAAG